MRVLFFSVLVILPSSAVEATMHCWTELHSYEGRGTSVSNSKFGYLECASGMDRCGRSMELSFREFGNLQGAQASNEVKGFLKRNSGTVSEGLMCMSAADCATIKAETRSSCVGVAEDEPCCCSGDGCTGAAGGLTALFAGAMAIALTAMRM